MESQNFESRKNVLKYDDVMSRQREVIYGERREVLEGADLQDQIRLMIDDARGLVRQRRDGGVPGGVGPRRAVDGTAHDVPDLAAPRRTSRGRPAAATGWSATTCGSGCWPTHRRSTTAREAELGSEVMRELERRVLLSVLDRKWREHLYEMDYLREGIGLRAYSQRDPLVEYQREGFDMFHAMKEGIREETVGFLFHIEVQVEEEPEEFELTPAGAAATASESPLAALAAPAPHAPHISAKGLDAPKTPTHLTYTAPSEDGEAEVRGQTVTNADDPYSGISRNALCPCGSGKKYKRCHGAPGGPTGETTRAGG